MNTVLYLLGTPRNVFKQLSRFKLLNSLIKFCGPPLLQSLKPTLHLELGTGRGEGVSREVVMELQHLKKNAFMMC